MAQWVFAFGGPNELFATCRYLFDMNNSESNYNSRFKPVEKSILLVEMKEMKRGSLN